MSSNIKVTYAEMESTANNLKAVKGDVDTALSRARTDVDRLMTDGFVTEKATPRFNEVSTEFHKGASEAMENLNKLSDWLTKATEAMRQMDQEMAGSLSP